MGAFAGGRDGLFRLLFGHLDLPLNSLRIEVSVTDPQVGDNYVVCRVEETRRNRWTQSVNPSPSRHN
jgi:hypothetical protein